MSITWIRGRTREFGWLLWSDLFVLRERWFWYFFQASLVPIVNLVFLWLLVGREGPQHMGFFITGSLVMGLGFGGLISLGQQIGHLKSEGGFEHYAALPISKAVFISAIATRGTLLSLPSTLFVLILGSVAFGMRVPLLAYPVLLLAAYAMAGFGAIIGFWAPTAQVASLATQVLQTVIVFLAPVFYPLHVLPLPLQWVAQIWPTTHTAAALRGATAGQPLSTIWPALTVLLGFVVLSMVLVPLKLDWRGRH